MQVPTMRSMGKRNDSDLLPLVLTGIAMLIMGTAVVMYPNEPGQATGRPSSSAEIGAGSFSPSLDPPARYTLSPPPASPQSTPPPAQ